MDANELKVLLRSLESAQSNLHELETEYSLLNLTGHQQEIRISVGDTTRTLSLARFDNATYTAVAVRGTEMVMLGVKKLYAARIDEARQGVREIEEKIRAECN